MQKSNFKIGHDSPQVIHERVHNLVKSIVQIAKTVIQCVRNDDPNFEPTQIGITRFSDMVRNVNSQGMFTFNIKGIAFS